MSHRLTTWFEMQTLVSDERRWMGEGMAKIQIKINLENFIITNHDIVQL